VGDPEEAHAPLPLEAQDQIQEVPLRQGIEGGRGLVQHQQGRVAGQRHGEDQALALAARQLVGPSPEEGRAAGQAQLAQEGRQPGQGPGGGFAPQGPGQEGEVLRHGEEGMQGLRRILGHPADPALGQGRAIGTPDRAGFQVDPGGRGAQDRPGQEGLPGSALAHQSQPLSGGQIEVQGAQQADSVRPLENQVPDFQGHGGRMARKSFTTKESAMPGNRP
jgi:hypothetical protein